MKMKLYNIRKVFTCCIPTKQSENNEMDKYNPLMESPTFVKSDQNDAKQKTDKETNVIINNIHDLPSSLIEMNEEDKKRLNEFLIAEYFEEYCSIRIF